MMERLSERLREILNEQDFCFDLHEMNDVQRALIRLGSYEDTGLTPEMVLRLIEEYGRLAIECEFYKTQDHAWDADWYKRAEEDETYPLKEAHNGE